MAWGIQWELDAREKPQGLALGLHRHQHARAGREAAARLRHGGVPARRGAGQRRAYELSRGVKLADSDAAKLARAAYPPPASLPPSVIRCDTLSGDTWWSGTELGERAEAWTRLLTDGKGRYCTTQQEDNATFEALQAGDGGGAGRRPSGWRCCAPARTSTGRRRAAVRSTKCWTIAEQGGFVPALQNLVGRGIRWLRRLSELGRMERGCAEVNESNGDRDKIASAVPKYSSEISGDIWDQHLNKIKRIFLSRKPLIAPIKARDSSIHCTDYVYGT